MGPISRGGADANALDHHGRTSLQDVLAWARLDREEEVILTIRHLVNSGADSEITRYNPTPRQLAETLGSICFRDTFRILQGGTRVRSARRSLVSHDLSVPEQARKDDHCTATQCGLQGSVKYVYCLEHRTPNI